MPSFEEIIRLAASQLAAEEPPTSPMDTPDDPYPCCLDCGAHHKAISEDAPYCPVCAQAHERGYKIGYKGGRCWNGAHRDAGTVNHMLPLTAGDTSFGTARCGTAPGARSYGWVVATRGQVLTCLRCLAKTSAEQKSALLTTEELDLMRLTHNSDHEFYGSTGQDDSEYDVWIGLVAKGLATKRNVDLGMGVTCAFILTDAGRAYL